MTWNIKGLLGIVLVLSACDADKSPVQVNTQDLAVVPMTPGFQSYHLYLSSMDEIFLGVYVPQMGQNQKVPLVVALHPGGPYTPYRGYSYMVGLVQPALSGLNAIMVAPDNLGANWIDSRNDQMLVSLIEAAKKVWPIDPDRIILTGYSMGGTGTWYLADKHPDLFDAAIPMGSTPIGFLSGLVPHFVIQGQYDELYGVSEVGEAVRVMRSKGRHAELLIADSLSHGEPYRYVSPLRQSIPWLDTILVAKSLN